MQQLDTTEKADQSNEWVNSTVMKSEGNLRICFDLKGLNQAKKRVLSQLPTSASELTCARVLSKLEPKTVLWRVKLDHPFGLNFCNEVSIPNENKVCH